MTEVLLTIVQDEREIQSDILENAMQQFVEIHKMQSASIEDAIDALNWVIIDAADAIMGKIIESNDSMNKYQIGLFENEELVET